MRWAPDARGRLERAALELFATQGFAATTVPQITARAGLTTRTFFRHFADKREVIFAGDEIPQEARRLIVAAPSDLAPLEVIRRVLHQVAAARFEGRHDETAAWRRIILSDDALRDRDARKRVDLVDAARDGLVERGMAPLDAAVHAELGVVVFSIALETWALEGETRSMTEVLDEVMAALPGTPARVGAAPAAPGGQAAKARSASRKADGSARVRSETSSP